MMVERLRILVQQGMKLRQGAQGESPQPEHEHQARYGHNRLVLTLRCRQELHARL